MLKSVLKVTLIF